VPKLDRIEYVTSRYPDCCFAVGARRWSSSRAADRLHPRRVMSGPALAG